MVMRTRRLGHFRTLKRYTWRTYAVTIPITDLVPGTNVVQLGSDQAMITSNVNIVLVDVPGGVPVLPGSNNAYPASQASKLVTKCQLQHRPDDCCHSAAWLTGDRGTREASNLP